MSQPSVPMELEQVTLLSRTEAPALPFLLTCQHGTLECQQLLRFLPGKRLVLRARLNGQMVIAKCFFGPSAKRDMLRELRGIEGFFRAGVNTPELIGSSSSQHIHVVITRELSPAISFERLWSGSLSEVERRFYLAKAGAVIGALHNAGVQQKDIHLDNLLLHKDDIYLIDGGGAEVSNSPLSSKKAINNLALFQAVLYPRFDCYISNVWCAYCQAAPKLANGVSLTAFSARVQQQRKWREKFVLKALRNCTRFRVEKSWRHFLSVDRKLDSEALQEVLADPEQAMADGEIIKRGRTNTLAVVSLSSGEQVLIKRFQSTKGFLHKYLRCLRPSRARRCWLNGFLLQMLGIDTPRPYAMLEKRFGPLTLCSYTINSFEPVPHAMAWFSQVPLPDRSQTVAKAISDILTTLQRSRVYHGDLKGNNFLIKDDQVLLIDLDSMTSHKNAAQFRRANRKDIDRFSRNWTNLPEAARLFRPTIKALQSKR